MISKQDCMLVQSSNCADETDCQRSVTTRDVIELTSSQTKASVIILNETFVLKEKMRSETSHQAISDLKKMLSDHDFYQ